MCSAGLLSSPSRDSESAGPFNLPLGPCSHSPEALHIHIFSSHHLNLTCPVGNTPPGDEKSVFRCPHASSFLWEGCFKGDADVFLADPDRKQRSCGCLLHVQWHLIWLCKLPPHLREREDSQVRYSFLLPPQPPISWSIAMQQSHPRGFSPHFTWPHSSPGQPILAQAEPELPGHPAAALPG